MKCPTIVRHCMKHGFQIFYETTTKNSTGDSVCLHRCSLCKHEYYIKNAEKIKQRNKKHSARNQAAYRKKLKFDVVQAYSPKLCCVSCKQRNSDVLSVVNNDGKKLNGKFLTLLRKNGYPEGFRVVCKECLKKIRLPQPRQS